MKNLISICFCLALAFSLSLNTSAQSTEKKLDQAELMKQWIGTWEMEIGGDSVMVMKVTPHNNGIFFIQEEKVNGNVYNSWKGSTGLSADKNMIMGSALTSNGILFIDIGKFVEEDKFISDRYVGNTTHAASQVMIKFSNESLTARFKWRGEGMNWPDEWGPKMTFKKLD